MHSSLSKKFLSRPSLLISLSLGLTLMFQVSTTDALAKQKEKKIQFNPGQFVGGLHKVGNPPGDEAEEEEEASAAIEEETKETGEKSESKDEKKEEEEEEPEAEPEPEPLEFSDPEIYLNKAKVFIKHKQYKKALVELNNCLSLNSNHWDARYLDISKRISTSAAF